MIPFDKSMRLLKNARDPVRAQLLEHLARVPCSAESRQCVVQRFDEALGDAKLAELAYQGAQPGALSLDAMLVGVLTLELFTAYSGMALAMDVAADAFAGRLPDLAQPGAAAADEPGSAPATSAATGLQVG